MVERVIAIEGAKGYGRGSKGSAVWRFGGLAVWQKAMPGGEAISKAKLPSISAGQGSLGTWDQIARFSGRLELIRKIRQRRDLVLLGLYRVIGLHSGPRRKGVRQSIHSAKGRPSASMAVKAYPNCRRQRDWLTAISPRFCC